ncbi:amidohydrolase family protein [Candidatus Micrarchaeota archaeon]|nr:amidohydrolase family protein [Candidatus Micrarchaeota archaeon]
MKIIDTHLHVTQTTGPVLDSSKEVGITPTIENLKLEMKKHNLVAGVLISSGDDPDLSRDIELLKKISLENENIKCIFGINPIKVRPKHFQMLEQEMKRGLINGIKIFPSYFPTYPNDKKYHKFYKLCLNYEVPVIVHTGAVIKSHEEKIYQKYAHPIHVDDLAVDFPKLKILMAHAGYPWLIDAAQIAYKNENVALDFSGLREGPIRNDDELDRHWMRWVLDYLDNGEKVMYGSDWPLVRMNEYISWLSKMVPKKLHKKFFYKNAEQFFNFDF